MARARSGHATYEHPHATHRHPHPTHVALARARTLAHAWTLAHRHDSLAPAAPNATVHRHPACGTRAPPSSSLSSTLPCLQHLPAPSPPRRRPPPHTYTRYSHPQQRGPIRHLQAERGWPSLWRASSGTHQRATRLALPRLASPGRALACPCMRPVLRWKPTPQSLASPRLASPRLASSRSSLEACLPVLHCTACRLTVPPRLSSLPAFRAWRCLLSATAIMLPLVSSTGRAARQT